MQKSMVFNQVKWPNAGDVDDCWVVSSIQCANMVAPWLRLPSVTSFRKAAGNPDRPGPTGGSSSDTVQGCETLWPRYFKGQLKVLRNANWSAFEIQVARNVPMSVSIVCADLPSYLKRGFNGLHRVSIVKGSRAGTVLWFDPLAPVYSRPAEVPLDDIRRAVMAYGRQKTGSNGAWAVVFPTAEHCAALYFGQVDTTPYDQEDIDRETAELRERIDDARDVLDGVQP